MPRKNFSPLPLLECRRKDARTWITQHGYVMEYCPEHPKASVDNAGCFYVHRLEMEQHLGRVLEAHEEIHHRNEIKTHNEIDNLRLDQKPRHMQGHMKEKHKNKPLNNQKYIDLVLKAAIDPTVYKADFVKQVDISLSTVNRILSRYKIQWVSPASIRLDKEHVLKALQEFSRSEAVKILGCSLQYLWNRYPEMMRKTSNRKLKKWGG